MRRSVSGIRRRSSAPRRGRTRAARTRRARSAGRSSEVGRDRKNRVLGWGVFKVNRETPHAPLGVSGSPHVLVNARPAVQVPTLRDDRIGGHVQADVTLERALALVAPRLLSRGDLARATCRVRLSSERARVPRRQVFREGRGPRPQPVPLHGTQVPAGRRRHPARCGAARSGVGARVFAC